ncbi:MAG TPA: PQQ-dependent sugar dehydrogenase, partial [Pirellulaceae bacterium]|nr:PQQ-dependent sugar dehydrogenase [Pirellulaceae bacterium]
GERRGILYSLAKRPDAKPEPALDLTTELKTFDRLPTPVKFDSLYAIAFHPKFKENRYCYVCYTLASTDKKVENLENGSRISRFKVTDTNPPKLDPASEEIVLTWLQGGHNGCELLFGPDGFLYISTGDARPPSPPDSLHTGQDITDLMSSVLRIDVDRKQDGMNYAIPADNPFVGFKIDGKPARPEVWAYGFRNPWRMSFDRKTGELWLGDVGWELWEMVHRVEKGGNYGWSVLEGRQPVQTTDQLGPTPVRPPVIELPHTIAASITGGYIYRGSRFPELVGSYIFGDWEFRRLWSARLVDGKLESLTEITRPNVRVVTFGEDSDGELYYMDYDTGAIHTLKRNDGAGQNKDFPTTLSATGLFSSVKDHAPAPGVIPYEINSPQWSDGASAVRWLALPGESGITVFPGQGKPMPSQVYWHSFRLHFPKDAVLLKTLSVELQPGSAASRRRIETQVLHFDGADWRAYSYRWRDDESDADLVSASGGERVLKIGGLLSDSVNINSATTTSAARGDASPREYVWQFNDRTQCMQCHSQWPQYAIGFSLNQLNREVSGGGGPSENQLVRLSRTGHLVRRLMDDKPDAPYDAKLVADEPRLADPRESAGGSLADRARAYLHANCSHCHRFNGGGVVGLDLLFDKPIVATKTLEPPMRGDFGLPEARIIAPGHPERSTLYFRMSKFGRDRMPHVGSELPDEAGLTLIADWIRSLDPNAASGGRTAGGESIELPSDAELPAFLERPDESLRAARAVARRELPATQTQRVLAAAAKLPFGPTRDLYDGYLPPDGKGRRLGPNPRPTLVTSLTGDVQRGKELFWAMSSKCASCHKVGDQGVNLGPELTAIGKKRSRDELLDSLLNPSRVVEPAFTAYQVTSGDGRTFTGLLVKRDAQQVVIRDVQNKEVTLPAADVERVQPSRTSLMPDGLLSQFTPQEAADLLAYLAAQK